MTDYDQQRPREGFRAWMGVLSAFKEAIEETMEELRVRGDISPERAKEAVRSGMRRVEEAVDDARSRLDFVPRREFELLRDEVAELRRRLTEVEGRGLPGGGTGGGIPVDEV